MFKNLNQAQQRAVMHKDGPLLVIAGAGSGKTRVITCRVARLINEEGVNPYNILALTFTNKASSEMKERIESLLGNKSLDIWTSTFHSACVRILRTGIDRLGYSKDFVIYDTVDQNALIKECIEETGLSEEKYSPMAISTKISLIKNNPKEPDNNSTIDEINDFDDITLKVFPVYQKKLKANNALDFDDLLLITVKLFKSESDLLEDYQNRFQYILVDEYQDTNYLQYLFISLLAKKYQNICVVGDEDQSIYRWRGANIENILSFEKNFKNAEIIKLEENYRSTKIILEASNYVISKNRKRKGKTLFTNNGAGEKITYYRAFNEKDEGDYISQTILEFQRKGKAGFSDIAVFYRTNAQSRVIEESLRKSGIPYQVIGGHKFYDRKEIKDVIAYCRVIVNPDDSVGLNRIFNTNNHGIGKVTLNKINTFASEKKLTRFYAMREMADSKAFSGAVRKKVEKFCGLLSRLREFAGGNSVSEVIKYIQAETGYVDKLMNENSFEARNRIENLKELITAAKSFEENNDDVSVSNFLDQAALVSDIDSFDDGHGSVALMTLHNSKGLEFPVVFITGMEERIFPHIRSMDCDEEMEEERRLCYVGMTRTKNRLFFLNAVTRKIYGMEQTNPPSEFIKDIPDELIETTASSLNSHSPLAYNRFPRKSWQKINDSKFSIGTKVNHSTFGNGIILDVNGSNDQEVLSVFFKGAGKKKLKSKYANLKVL
tara:strand:+ start:211 stop:2364 length:2154 start_codon:yes stop_codon:yes gene_type:complete